MEKLNRPIAVSIVIPAYNEGARLPVFLETVAAHCRNSALGYEIIVVDDGSADATIAAAESFRARFGELQIVRIRKNRGKGYAVKRGLLKARGEVCVFMDADGSVAPDEIEKNLHWITTEGHDVFVGSRVLTGPDQVLRVKWYRKAIGLVFNFLVRHLLFGRIHDTQCGFKMFKKHTVRPLFSRSYLRGFGFDIEILFLAHKMGYRVKEGPVSWKSVPGSKVNLVTDSLKMFANILQIRNWHFTPTNPASKFMMEEEYGYMYEMEEYHWWFVGRNRLVRILLERAAPGDGTLLDVGCGTGGNLRAFRRAGRRAAGVDASEKAVSFCRKNGLEDVRVASAESLPYADASFDVVTCLDVLEHVQNPVTALQEIRRVLKPGGKAVVTVPAFRFLWSQHDDALGHLRRYEKKHLEMEIHEAGLTAAETGYFFFTSFFFVAPIRLVRRLFVKPGEAHSDTTTLPPKLLNDVLKAVCRLESSWHSRLPFGTTLYAILCVEK